MADLSQQQEVANDTKAKPASRRQFVLSMAVSALALGLGGLAYMATRIALPGPRPLRLKKVGRIGDFIPGTWRLLSDAPVYVFASDRGVAAVSARCTHLGCTVRRRGEGFVCPCHGSHFDHLGNALTPPAERALDWLRVQVVQGDVYVDANEVVPQQTYTDVGGRLA